MEIHDGAEAQAAVEESSKQQKANDRAAARDRESFTLATLALGFFLESRSYSSSKQHFLRSRPKSTGRSLAHFLPCMFPCSRRCLTGKISHPRLVLPTQTPAAASLLFLYPRWFVNHAEPRETFSRDDGSDVSIKREPTSKVRPVAQPEPREPIAQRTKLRNPWPPPAGAATAAPFGGPNSTPESNDAAPPRRQVVLPLTDKLDLNPFSQPLAASHTQSATEGRENAGFVPQDVKPNSSHEVEQVQNERIALRKARRDRLRERYRPTRFNWLHLAELLSQIQPASQSRPKIGVQIDQNALQHYAGSSRPNTWIHAAGRGVNVSVSSGDKSSNSRLLTLSGSDHAVVAAQQDLSKLNISPQSQQTSANPKSVTPPRSLEGSDPKAITSIRAFTLHVFRLTDPKRAHMQERPSGLSRNQYTARALIDVFTDSTSAAYASTVALNRSLWFACRHTDLEYLADFLHQRAKDLNISADISTYNLLLQMALWTNMFATAEEILKQMYSHGLSANSHTWTILFAAVRSDRDKLRMADLIRHSGVEMTSRAWATMARVAFDTSFDRMPDSAEEMSNLVNQLDQVFGAHWITPPVYRRMLRACLGRRHNRILNFLLNLQSERNIPMGPKQRTSLFALHRNRKDVQNSFQLLRDALMSGDWVNYKFDIPYVFMTAWDKKCTNLCRVLWWHCAVEGNITYTMRSILHDWLAREETEETERDRERSQTQKHVALWRRKAAKLIVDSNQGFNVDDIVQRFPLLAGSRPVAPHAAMDLLSRPGSGEGFENERKSLAHQLIRHDIDAPSRDCRMSRDEFREVLERAWELDQQWRSKLIVERGEISELLQRVIETPKRKSTPFTIRKIPLYYDRSRSRWISTSSGAGGGEVKCVESSVGYPGNGKVDRDVQRV